MHRGDEQLLTDECPGVVVEPSFESSRIISAIARDEGVRRFYQAQHHIITTVADSYVKVGIASAVVPLASSYKTVDVMWGTLAFNLLLIVAGSGFLRVRMKERVWRVIHLSAYLAWVFGMVHFISIGTDGATNRWGFWLAIVATFAVAAAAVLRVVTPNGPQGPMRSVAGGL